MSFIYVYNIEKLGPYHSDVFQANYFGPDPADCVSTVITMDLVYGMPLLTDSLVIMHRFSASPRLTQDIPRVWDTSRSQKSSLYILPLLY